MDASAFPGAPVPGAYGAGVPAGYAPAAGTPSKKLNLSKLALGLLGGYLAAPKQSLTTTALFAANSMLNSNPFSGIGGLGNSLAPQQPMTEDQAVQYLRQLYPYRSDQEIWAAMQILRGQ